MSKQCDNCKWWAPIGRKNDDGVWEQSKTMNDLGVGWCQKNPPVYLESNKVNCWPQTTAENECGGYESSHSEVAELRERMQNWRFTYWATEKAFATLKKQIRDIGEKHGISRRKQPSAILKLLESSRSEE